MRLQVISCRVFRREMEAAAERSPNQVDLTFLSMGLHETGCTHMKKSIQAALDAVPEADYDAILLGYGLCNRGIVGLRAGAIPLVVPRAHDCITLLMGSKERYLDYFDRNPGTYFKSSGWIEGRRNSNEPGQLSISEQNGLNATYEEMVAQYGEDNARYLQDQIGNQTRHYGQMTFIEMGIEPDDRFERHAWEEARQRGWKFEQVRGTLSLIQHLVDGDWNDQEFLVVPPRGSVVATYHQDIIGAHSS